MKVLISGAGIAGSCLGYWLLRHGVEVTLVEQAPALRTGGYIIDFWGAGFEVADRMGLLPRIRSTGYSVREVKVVSRNGARVSGFSADVFARVTHGRYTSLSRGDLAAILYSAIDGAMETIFGDSITQIEQTSDAVRVIFERHPPRTFDLVIGADGLHSRVRALALGPETAFEHYLGIKVAAFEVAGYQPRDELVYVMYTEVGQQVTRFALQNDRTLFLMTFADEDAAVSADLARQRAALRARFGQSGWECPRILDALDTTAELYFDRVSQIRIPPSDGWCTRGRVALVGDAASCVSLLAGEGSSLAMTAAYILAGELTDAQGDHRAAFNRYTQRFQPFIVRKQQAARRFAGAFAPKSAWSLFLRNRLFQILSIPWVAGIVTARGLTDDIVLPDY